MRTAVSVALLLLTGCGPDKVAPPRPRAAGGWTDTLPPVPASYIDGPVQYHLAPALAWLDSTIPPRLGDLEERRKSPDNPRLSYAFQLQRDPFTLSVRGRSAALQTDVAYRARAWYNPPVLPEIGASCGLEGDAPRARLAVAMDLRLASDWTLHPRTKTLVDPLSETDHDKCTITALEIDVTGAVMNAARTALQQKAEEAGARLAAVDLPREARRIWEVLHRPIRITDSLWLTVNPSAVRIGGLELRGDTLLTTVGLSAHPRVLGGARPAPKIRPLPPPQDSTAHTPALHLLSEARLPYGVASSILTRELRGTRIQAAGRALAVDSLHLAGVGDGRMAVGLAVSGPVEGLLWAVGHPAYDAATSKLFMPDLRWDTGTRNALTGALAWLGGETVERFLRTNVRVDLGPTIEDGRELLEKSLNQELAEGVRLRAEIRAGQVHGIRAAPEALLVRAVASGRAEIILTPR
ncbi:MAG: DUF4403 family protein, partial [Gemmatimonadales bacterium]